MIQREGHILAGGSSTRLHFVAPSSLPGMSRTPSATVCSLSMPLAQPVAKNRYGQFLQRLLVEGVLP